MLVNNINMDFIMSGKYILVLIIYIIYLKLDRQNRDHKKCKNLKVFHITHTSVRIFSRATIYTYIKLISLINI